ncbi:hypothetical protein MOSE0_I01706 [Monosporozyma servazzii]
MDPSCNNNTNINIDELLRSPSLTPCTYDNINSDSLTHSENYLFDYTDLYNNTNGENYSDCIDHIPENNYKLWLNSNIIKI